MKTNNNTINNYWAENTSLVIYNIYILYVYVYYICILNLYII